MTTVENAAVLSFDVNDVKLNVLVITDDDGDCLENIWNDICSFLCNVNDAADNLEYGLRCIFEDYPNCNYKIQEEM